MKIKYGEIPDEMLKSYVDGMSGKVYKILPMKEKKIPTLPKYIKATLREFVGAKQVVFLLKENQDFLTVIDILESLLSQNDMEKFKSDIFKALGLVDRMKKYLDGEIK